MTNFKENINSRNEGAEKIREIEKELAELTAKWNCWKEKKGRS